MSDKKEFYIFLDFDGVFNYFDYVTNAVKNNHREENALYVCEDIVQFFNQILNDLRQNNFEPKIVISSDRRFELMNELVNQLTKHKVDYSGQYDKTGQISVGERRGCDIKEYIIKHKINGNYMVIDDKTEDIKHYIKPNHILKTSGLSGTGLNQEDYNTFKQTNLKTIIENNKQQENTKR